MSEPIESNNADPLHIQIREWIRGQIRKGVYRNGDQLPPEVDLAERLGVGRGTVRQAVLALVHEGLLYRVRGRGTFVQPSGMSGAEEALEGSFVLVLVDRWEVGVHHNPFYVHALEGIRRVLAQSGLSVVYGSTAGNETIPEALDMKRCRGVFLMNVLGDRLVESALNLKIPILSLHDRCLESGIYSVTVDNVRGGYMAAECLVKAGCGRIAMLGAPVTHHPFLDRQKGYQKAISHYGYEVDTKSIVNFDLTIVESYKGARQLLELDPPPDGIFAITDLSALGVYQAARDLGRRIGVDLSVVAYDDEHFAACLAPPLTSIRQPAYEVGVCAAETYLAMTQGETLQSNQSVLQPSLVERQSHLLRDREDPEK